MDKENGDNGGDKNKGGGLGSGGQPDPNSLLDAASLFGKFCYYFLIMIWLQKILTFLFLRAHSLLGTRWTGSSSRGGCLQFTVWIAIRRCRCWSWPPARNIWWWRLVGQRKWRRRQWQCEWPLFNEQPSASPEHDGRGRIAGSQFGWSTSSEYVLINLSYHI